MGEIPINMSHFLMVEEIFTRETPIVFMKQEKFFRKKQRKRHVVRLLIFYLVSCDSIYLKQ